MWYRDGKIKEIRNYKNGKLYKLFESWSNEGELLNRYNFKDEKSDDLLEKYFNNTQLLQNTLLPYFNSPYPLVSLNKKFSKLNYEKYNTHIQPHGTLETYDFVTKTILEKINYKNGIIDGLYEQYHNNGLLFSKINYVNGKTNGVGELWYENGRLYKKFYSKDDKPDGLYEIWHEVVD